MAIRVQSTSEIVIDSVKTVVYGGPGIGKTRLVASAPTPLIISAESGLLSLTDLNVDYIEVNTQKEFDEAYRFMKSSEEAKKYETVGLDSLSEIAEALLAKVLPDYKDPRQAYAFLAQTMMPVMRKFRDLPSVHTVFTAKMITVEDEESGRVTDELLLPGKVLGAQVPYMVDELFYMGLNKKKDVVLHTAPTRRTFAKDRSGALKSEEEPNMTTVINKIMAKQASKKQGN